MQYWIRINGVADGLFTQEELFAKYGSRLTAETPCAKAGERKWGKLSDYFPDWQNPAVGPSAPPPGSGIPQKVVERYFHAYNVADSVTRIGGIIKILALVGAVIAGFAGIVISASSSNGLFFFLGLLQAVSVAIPIYVIGILVEAAGRLSKASIDTAVHTSPFLTESKKAALMSLN